MLFEKDTLHFQFVQGLQIISLPLVLRVAISMLELNETAQSYLKEILMLNGNVIAGMFFK